MMRDPTHIQAYTEDDWKEMVLDQGSSCTRQQPFRRPTIFRPGPSGPG